ncbi:hypothetical protein PAXRUDRAFT_10406 [Paxillus rubicundulus Ve08.2h10]|uniref:Uncharacterized protein n=1 Tax=Paxillus rubicundulus Ve08.2h10 TaxID=930991 RepID=A0A0D0E0R9_9AGAM|nr:hypothetical protein PAXRUDRAFT_10406 [Paxillus rubicundulus Ve08.2h10]
MSGFTLSLLLAQSEPVVPQKPAQKMAFKVAALQLHMEWDMWRKKWQKAMDAMDMANQGTLGKGLTLKLSAGVIPSVHEADDTHRCIVNEAIVRKGPRPMLGPLWFKTWLLPEL